MSSYLKIDTSLDTYVTFATAGFPAVGTSSASFAVWIRIGDRSVSSILFQKYDGSTGYQAKFNEEVNGDLSLEFLVDGTTSATARIDNVPVKLDEWQLFVFILERLDTLKIYIDSVLHADTDIINTPAGTVDNSDDFYMGFDSVNPSSSLLGKIDTDSFSFYNAYILSESEIRDLYNKGQGDKIDGTETGINFGLNFDEGTGVTVTDNKVSSLVGTISSNASPFDDVWSETGGVAVMLPSNIKMYLTSLEPDMAQTNYTQSIGGYISTSLLYPWTTLASSLGLYGTSITLIDSTDLIGYGYISMVNEIVQVENILSTSVVATERGVNEIIGYYPSGTIVQGVVSPFNDSFNTDRKQYRCYAIKNTSTTESAYGVSAYFRQLSRNTNTTMRLALEIPKTQGATGVSTSWTSSMLIDSSLAGTYEDNWFAEAYIIFEDSPNAGEKSRISSYDGATGTFVFADSLPLDFDPLVHSLTINYTVDISPCQRVKSGVDAPADTDFITDFSEAANRDVSVDLSTIKEDGLLSPGEIIYIWIERKIGKSNSSYDENSFVLSIDFEKELEGN